MLRLIYEADAGDEFDSIKRTSGLLPAPMTYDVFQLSGSLLAGSDTFTSFVFHRHPAASLFLLSRDLRCRSSSHWTHTEKEPAVFVAAPVRAPL